MKRQTKRMRIPFSKESLRKMVTFGHSVYATRFSTEYFGGLEYCPKLFRIYNDLGDADYIEYDSYGEHPSRARCYIEGIALCPRSVQNPKSEGPWKLTVVTIMISMMNSKFDDLAEKKKEMESAALELIKECAAKFNYPLTVSEKLKFKYYRHPWDPWAPGGKAIQQSEIFNGGML